MPITQDNRLLQISIDGFKTPLYITAFTGMEKLSAPFEYTASITVQGNTLPQNIMGTTATITITRKQQTRYLQGYITHVTQTSTHADEHNYQIQIHSFLQYLKQRKNQRIFENLSVIEIVSKICKEKNYYHFDISQLNKTYAPIPYVVQYQESDLALIQRLLANYGIQYYFKHEQKKHTLVFFDLAQTLPNLGQLNYSNSESGNPDIYAWRNQYTVTPNHIALQCNNQNTSPKLLTETKTNKNENADDNAFLATQTHYICENYEDADLQRLTQLQLAYWQSQSQQFSGKSTRLHLTTGACFTLAKFPVNEENTDYLLTEIHYHAEDNTHKTNQQKTTQYFQSNFICQKCEDSIVRNPIFYPPTIDGPQTGFITGEQKQQPNTQTTLTTSLRHIWDEQSNQEKYPYKKYRTASIHASKQYGSLIQPREASEALLQMIQGNPTQTVNTGELYNAEIRPNYATDKHPYRNTLLTNTLSNTTQKAHNEISFIDNQGQEKLYQHAANTHLSHIAGEANINTGHTFNHAIAGDQEQSITKDVIHSAQQSILLKAGRGQIKLTPSNISFISPKVTTGNPASASALASIPITQNSGAISPLIVQPSKSPQAKTHPEATVNFTPVTTNTVVSMHVNSYIQTPQPVTYYHAKVTTSGKFKVIQQQAIDPEQLDQQKYYRAAQALLVDFLANMHITVDTTYRLHCHNANLEFIIDYLQSNQAQLYIHKTYQNYLIQGELDYKVELSEIKNHNAIIDHLNKLDIMKPKLTGTLIEQTIDLGTTMLTPTSTMQVNLTYSGKVTAELNESIQKQAYNENQFIQQVNDALTETLRNLKCILKDGSWETGGTINIKNQVIDYNNITLDVIMSWENKIQLKGHEHKTQNILISGINFYLNEQLGVDITIHQDNEQKPLPLRQPIIPSIHLRVTQITPEALNAKLLFAIPDAEPAIKFLPETAELSAAFV